MGVAGGGAEAVGGAGRAFVPVVNLGKGENVLRWRGVFVHGNRLLSDDMQTAAATCVRYGCFCSSVSLVICYREEVMGVGGKAMRDVAFLRGGEAVM